MLNYQSAAPILYSLGFQDRSARKQVSVVEQIPQHFPHFYTYGRKGRENTALPVLDAATLTSILGAESFDYRGKYANHNTPFINEILGAGNAIMVERLRPADAADESRLILALDLLPTTVAQYQRGTDGNYLRDGTGSLIPTGTSVPGYLGRWVVISANSDAFGSQTQRVGGLVDGSTQSTIYPMFEFEASSFGEWGNGLGVRLWAPSAADLDPIDVDLAEQQKSYIFRVQVVERSKPTASPVIQKTIMDVNTLEFALNPNAINTRTDSDLFVDNVFMKAYQDLNAFPKQYGPFGKFKVYHQNVKAVCEMLHDAETAVDATFPIEDGAEYLMNFLSARNLNGNPYHSFILHGALDGAPVMNEISTHYLGGGSDGTMSMQAFAELVKEKWLEFGDGVVPYRDQARYPYSAFYDAGFPLETKDAMPRLMGVRKSAHIALATQDILQPANDLNEESSIAVSLRAKARLYPESIIFGTACCRAVIMGHAGELVNSNWPHPVPGTLELAIKRAKYMGAANGQMKGEYAYDDYPNNVVKFLTSLNNTYRSDNVKHKNWAAGLIWAQSNDMRSDFIPATQTVYDDDTSVLNDDITMQICCDVSSLIFYVWRELTGNGKLTKTQFIERSNRRILELTKDRYDGRVVIQPDTYFTPADDANGYSWNCRVHVYANKSKTVAAATVVTHRMEELV